MQMSKLTFTKLITNWKVKVIVLTALVVNYTQLYIFEGKMLLDNYSFVYNMI